METVEIKKENFLKAYEEAEEKVKKVLKKLAPSIFKKRWDEMETWEDICDAAGIHPILDLPYPKPISDKQEGQNAFFQATTIREVFNEGREVNWADSSEYKYAPWLKVNPDKTKPTGFGLSYYDFDITYTYTFVGSRLSYNTSAKAKRAFEKFPQVYEKPFLINNNY